jgi:hypothetical protein
MFTVGAYLDGQGSPVRQQFRCWHPLDLECARRNADSTTLSDTLVELASDPCPPGQRAGKWVIKQAPFETCHDSPR